MKLIKVVCGVVIRSNNQILITQRGDDKNRNKWEFPGGKVKTQESLYDSIRRELNEELGIIVNPEEVVFEVVHDKLKLFFIRCRMSEGIVSLNEHLDYRWVTEDEFGKFEFLDGDKKYINHIKK